jgi:hypothetical protein
MAQSTREYAVVAIQQSQTGGVAAASRSVERIADARAILCTTGPARRLTSLRHQIAIARTLLDELEDSVPSSPFLISRSAQLIEELRRLAARVRDAADVFAEQEEAGREERRSG